VQIGKEVLTQQLSLFGRHDSVCDTIDSVQRSIGIGVKLIVLEIER